MLDGSFLRRNKGLYVVMDAYDHHIIHGGYNIREGGKDLKSIYQHLAARGLHPESATVDGNPQQINYSICTMAYDYHPTMRGARSTSGVELVSKNTQTNRCQTVKEIVSNADRCSH